MNVIKRKALSTFITLMLLAALVFPTNLSYASNGNNMTGAIFTTDENGDKVNKNIFDLRTDVYLNGGPDKEGAAGLPDGSYYVRVTDPSGKLVLGESKNTVVEVVYGEFEERYQLWDIVYSGESDFTEKGYDLTENPGGEYKVWVSQSKSFKEKDCKTDNFKVREHLINPDPKLCITKEVTEDPVRIGDVVTYTFIVHNIGNTDLNEVVVTDCLFGSGWEYYIGDLSAGEVTEPFTKTYTVQTLEELQQINGIVVEAMEDGSFKLINKAKAEGEYLDELIFACDDAELIVLPDPILNPFISITKSVYPTSAKVGDSVTYSFTVENTGDVDLTNVVVTDPLFGSDWEYYIGELSAGEKTEPFTETYTVQSIEVLQEFTGVSIEPITDTDNYLLTNTAKVEGKYSSSTVIHSASAELVILPDDGSQTPTPSIKITKDVNHTSAKVGDSVTYSFTVENTGDVDLTNVVVTDPLFGSDWEYYIGELSAGEKTEPFTETYTVQSIEVLQEFTGVSIEPITDTDNYLLTNTAKVEGKYSSSTVVHSASADLVILPDDGSQTPTPSIDFSKAINKSSAEVGDNVTYSFTVTNNGDVDLINVVVTDPLFGSEWYRNVGDLAIGQSKTIEADNFEIPSIESLQGIEDIEFTRLEDGNYNLKNTATVTGYYGDSDNDYLTKNASVNLTIIISDDPDEPSEPEKGSIKIIKTLDSEDGTPQEGVTFEITRGTYKKSKVTDSNGIIKFSELKAGVYTVKEIVPDDYTTNLPDGYTVTVKEGKTSIIKVVNTLIDDDDEDEDDDDEDEDEDDDDNDNDEDDDKTDTGNKDTDVDAISTGPNTTTTLPSDGNQQTPDLPNTGGAVELEIILSGLGSLLFASGIVLKRKKR